MGNCGLRGRWLPPELADSVGAVEAGSIAWNLDLTSFRAVLRTAGTRVLDGSAGAVKFFRNSAT